MKKQEGLIMNGIPDKYLTPTRWEKFSHKHGVLGVLIETIGVVVAMGIFLVGAVFITAVL